jgi:hypothetical protein
LNEASQGGDPMAKFEYAMAILNNKINNEMRERFAFIKRLLFDSADQNYAPALAKIGQLINSGDCDFKKDPDLAKNYQDKSRELIRKNNNNGNNRMYNQSRIPIRRQRTKKNLSLSINTNDTY